MHCAMCRAPIETTVTDGETVPIRPYIRNGASYVCSQACIDASIPEARAREIARSMGLTVKAAFKGDRCPPWIDKRPPVTLHTDRCNTCGSVHGDRYRVTLRMNSGGGETIVGCRERICVCHDLAEIPHPDSYPDGCSMCGCRRAAKGRTLSFDYWHSYHDKKTGTRPGYYDILACVALDASGPTDPDEIAEEYGPMKPSQAVASAKHAARLRAFFTQDELAKLAEVDR